MRRWWTGIGMLAACGGEPRVCTPEECAAISPPPAAPPPGAPPAGLTEFEAAAIQPLLDDLREGVRPWTDQAIGVCRGARTCEAWVGTAVGDLPPGDYVVRAEIGVPQLGPPGLWTAAWQSECEVRATSAKGEARTRKVKAEKSFELHYAGPNQGYRLEPLQRIESPGDGAQSCTWSLTLGSSAAAPQAAPQVFEGSWSVPDKPRG